MENGNIFEIERHKVSPQDVEQVFTKILNDFIDESVIGYDILSELNKFDQYIVAGSKYPTFVSNDLDEERVNVHFKESMNIDKILTHYGNRSWTRTGHTVYICKLCKASVNFGNEFFAVDDFLAHIQKLHANKKSMEHEQVEQNLDKKCDRLGLDELEKMKTTKYKRHNEDFLKKIDEIFDMEDFKMNAIHNSLYAHKTTEPYGQSELSSDSCKENANLSPSPSLFSSSSSSPSSSPSTNSMPMTYDSTNRERIPKKKKKRTSGLCEICNRTFNDLYNLRIHMMIHTGEKPFQCEECGKRFRQFNKLKIHCITHTNEKPYICDICEKGFRFRNYLSVHKRLHSGENPYKCKFCDEYFHSLHSRRLHTKLLHCEAKTFNCPICAKVLTAQCYLTAHMKRHTNQRDYKCDTCNKCFFSQSQLKDHQLVHTNLKPYQCNVCNARFQRKSNFTQHLKIHTGEKTYVCHICCKAFAQNAGLYGHMKSHAK